ncbi:MAG: MFS transporter [Geodermatophilaceae bacterium]|nr:MFS transporter [Geodermatophilaceae bacterium]
MVGVMSGMLLAALDQSIVGTALPTITSELGGLDKLSWVVTAYLLTATAVTPLWGKISDLYGRRLIFQIAISIFLVGSALCGFAQNIDQLIAFRALQGIGGGGLFSIALSIIGDVIPPRERGRYQGYFGAVFGASSVAGPLLGGFFTDGPGWRWIFYINLPIGIAALFITSAVLTMPVVKREHKIDYPGALAIVGGVTSLLLYLEWRGRDYGWTSPGALALLAAFVLLTVAFVMIEQRASEPIIPMRLFRNGTYRVGNIFGFCAGVVMFGSIVFLPLYLQAVKGWSATESGLGMTPIVVGLLGSSIVAGNLMTKTGRYKVFPITGSVLMLIGLLLLTTLSVATPYWQLALFMLVFGAGLGMTMQTLVTAIQNDVPQRDMGTATGSTTFFRQMGGAIGTAAFGAVLGVRLSSYLADGLGDSAPAGSINTNDLAAIRELTGPVEAIVLRAFGDALGDVFLVGIPFLVIALVAAVFLKEKPLQTGGGAPSREQGSREQGVAEEPVVASP